MHLLKQVVHQGVVAVNSSEKYYMIPTVRDFVSNLDTTSISLSRKDSLQKISDYIFNKQKENQKIRLTFICTHNSRRSHFTQVWAHIMAHFYSIDKVECFSGGTEATSVYPSVIESLSEVGLEIHQERDDNNPFYFIRYDDNEMPIIGFSKKFSHPINPKSGFAAIMTCSSADEDCPFVFASELRIAVRYDDPKAYDGTDLMNAKYEERSLEIASEMYYVFSQIKK